MTPQHASKQKTSTLAFLALGVVYGDIGTSPLYAFKEAFSENNGLAPTSDNVLATLSALFWAITLIVSLKYVGLILRFDNKGEGGVLALQALALRHIRRARPSWYKTVVIMGIFAAALFYADAMITPAISVLSAVEGISIATPHFEHLIIPVALGVIAGLFLIQRFGTTQVGRLFGPITLIWFLTLGTLGVHSILQTPDVLRALNPEYAIAFLVHHPAAAFLLLTAIFLTLTGGEALYADMGHFGAKPIRLAWYGLVWPALVLNYFGQGALVMRNPEASANPFYLLSPEGLLVPLVVLATVATVVASQATISGAFSLTHQAIQLGYLPRMHITHTSSSEQGQIYIAGINRMMFIGVILLILGFSSSTALAGAYGVAVSGTMVITSVLVLLVTLHRPRQSFRKAIVIGIVVCLLLELLFLTSNLTKVTQGGWMPLLIGFILFTILSTWRSGRQWLIRQRHNTRMSVSKFISAQQPGIHRINGLAVYLTTDPTRVPASLLHNMKYFKVIHQQLVFLHVEFADIPYVKEEERFSVVWLTPQLCTLNVRFGFRERTDLTQTLSGLKEEKLKLLGKDTRFFVERATVLDCGTQLSGWRCNLFRWMMHQSESPARYYNLPFRQVLEISV